MLILIMPLRLMIRKYCTSSYWMFLSLVKMGSEGGHAFPSYIDYTLAHYESFTVYFNHVYLFKTT